MKLHGNDGVFMRSIVFLFRKWLPASAAVLAILIAGCGGSSSKQTTPTPTFTPAAGSYTSSQTVTIGDGNSAAVLYCTTDGSTPTTSSPQCAEPTTVSQTETINAIAVAPGQNPSAVATAAYTINLPPAATPTFAPDPTVPYTSAQSVTISDATANATIYYTATPGTTGTAPTTSSSQYTPGTPIMVSATTTIEAMAVATGYSNSAVATATYTITIPTPTPTISSPGGTSTTYPSTLSVTLSDSDAGATIYYTTNGNMPTTSSTKYTTGTPITVSSTETIQVIAIDTAGGLSASQTASQAFTVLEATPTFSPVAGQIQAGGTVTILDADPNATIYYTTNGSTATTSGNKYSNSTPITVSSSETINAIAINTTSGYNVSANASAAYTVPPAAPMITPNGGAITTSQTITLSDTTSGVTIYYTIDGTDPTTSPSRTQYGTPFALTQTGSVTVRAVAYSSGIYSSITSATFTVSAPSPSITGLTPSSGSVGTPVTISGSNFGSAMGSVSFGNTAASVSSWSNSSIGVTVPSGLSLGSVSVTVTTSGGQTASANFTVTAAAPIVSGVSPSAGPLAGGTTVTISGSNFASGATVAFGNTPGTDVTVNSPTSITATSPAGTGTVNVTVTVGSGTSATSAADQFTYDAAPTVTNVSSNTGPSSGGTSVTITGSNFVTGATVDFGTNNPATVVTVTSPTSITATSPAGTGTVNVTVTTPGGTSATNSNDQFTYTSSGPSISGTVVSGTTGIDASVQLYAAGTGGYGQGATPIGGSVNTNATTGAFSGISYDCSNQTAPNDQLYLVATGTGANSGVVLMTALGSCSNPSYSSGVTVVINEVTTIASAYALEGFASLDGSGGIAIGAPATYDAKKYPSCNAAGNWLSTGANTCNYTGLVNAFNTVNNLVNVNTGTALTITPFYAASPTPGSNFSYVPQARINSLANILASCVDATSSCSTLFSNAKSSAGATPADTLQAALNIAQNPGANVAALYGLQAAAPPYGSTTANPVTALTATPNDWTLALTFEGGGYSGEGQPQTNSIAIDGFGNVWTAGNADPSLTAFSPLGAALYSNGFYGVASQDFAAVAPDIAGNIWVANGDETDELTGAPGALSTNQRTNDKTNHTLAGLALDPTSPGYFWVDEGTQLEQYESTGTSEGYWTRNGLSFPGTLGSIALDGLGYVWAVDTPNNALWEIQIPTTNRAFPSNHIGSAAEFTGSGVTLAVDSSGNVLACSTGSTAGITVQSFSNGNFTSGTGTSSATYTASGRCGNAIAMDGADNIWVLGTDGSGLGYLDELSGPASTTPGTLLSPATSGYTGTASASTSDGETTSILLSSNFTQSGNSETSLAVDGSGNLWVLNGQVGNNAPSTYSSQLVEFIGIAAPVATPIEAGVQNSTLASKP